ncbi:hypothetical protein Acr_15g0009770 [Actinidia rufa]|uniref:Uncharacterized protein n=1 Tax=Actinidia rufa TaxID=165716 RepID=A0A7J0FUJ3_9ERIC|nr:hypothetical protein Acr_15g0009770 [Actinidia rufa]
MSTPTVSLASSVEIAWRGPTDSFYLGQEGSEITFGILMWRWNFIGLMSGDVHCLPWGEKEIECRQSSGTKKFSVVLNFARSSLKDSNREKEHSELFK